MATLSTVGLLAVTATSAIGGGNITSDGAAPITARGVCWSTRPNPTIAGSKTTNGTGTGSFTSFLTELTPVTTYYVRAYATNSVGTAYGNQVSVTTSYYGDGDYILLQEATIGNGVDLVFMGDGYTAAEIASGKYEEVIQEAVDIFFEVEPYKSYSEYFNVYIIYAVSEESGIGDIEQTVTNKFGTRFSAYQREMQTDLKKCFQYAAYAPIATLSGTTVVLIANTSVYGGTTVLYPEMPSVAICAHHSEFRYILQHEGGGHGFGKLADEYVESGNYQIPEWGIDELRGFQYSYGFFFNVDVTDNLSNIRWKHFIGLPNYSYVGAYEGGYYYEKGVWRPEDHSTMRDIMTDYFNAPSREIIVKRIMLLAGLNYSFESFKSRDIAQPGIQLRTAAIPKSQLQPLPKPVIVDPKRDQSGGLP